MLLRVAVLVGACVLIVGSAWLFSGNLGQKGVDQAPNEQRAQEPSKEDPASKPIVEPSKLPKDPAAKPNVDSSKPLSDAKASNIIKVDLSKLPPDLVKKLQDQGAVIEGKGQPGRPPSGKKRPPEDPSPQPKPAEPPNR